MTTEVTNRHDTDTTIIEQVVVGGDLEKLSPAQRTTYYARVCETLGLNPFTKPFDYIRLSGKLVLYATRTATDQLARQAKLSLETVSTERVEDVYLVTARATDPTGRTVTNVGAVEITALKGATLANAIMKAHTKAYRRATLSFCGLGWLDETEIETIAGAQRVVVAATGEIIDSSKSETIEDQAHRRELVAQIGADSQTLMITPAQLHKDAEKKDGVSNWEYANLPYLESLAKRMTAQVAAKQKAKEEETE